MKKICLSVLFLISFSASFYGEEGYAFKKFYEIEVELDGTDRDSVTEGMGRALKNLMISLSGVSDINNQAIVEKAIEDSERYVTEYRLSSEAENILGTFSFNGEEVRKLLSSNNLTLWIGIKPKILTFLPCKSQSFLILDEQDVFMQRNKLCTEVEKRLSRRGSIRNIIFIEPILDLIDLKFIDLYQPKSDQVFLNKISSRYGLDNWMVCYIQDEYGILIEEPLCLSPISDLQRIALEEIVDLLADELSKDFLLKINPNLTNELQIQVSGIEKYDQITSLENIIRSNALVISHSINSISDSSVTYLLEIRGEVSDLEKLMNVNPLLISQPGADGKEELKYVFKGNK